MRDANARCKEWECDVVKRTRYGTEPVRVNAMNCKFLGREDLNQLSIGLGFTKLTRIRNLPVKDANTVTGSRSG